MEVSYKVRFLLVLVQWRCGVSSLFSLWLDVHSTKSGHTCPVGYAVPLAMQFPGLCNFLGYVICRSTTICDTSMNKSIVEGRISLYYIDKVLY